ncbi:hypothetical protein [Burkholderia cepacia]|uniref:hypothetical protein n=1 Tax=Burkholderia cepacia TaxID=292 RepID=UPI000AEFA78B|nr:hypothetical protein [Burkholderia cepacia]
MSKNNFFLLFYLVIFMLMSPCVYAFGSNSDGSIITEWEIFKATVENYKKNIGVKENIKNAALAEKRGRFFFNEGRYDQAYFNGYGDAIAWIPRPEYFFIIGDLKLRMKLSLHSDAPHATPEQKACWDKYLFAVDVNRNLESSFEIGFGLVGELNLSDTRKSKIYKQAMANATCFARLTSKYSEGVGSQCVPIEEVKKCLGSPLLFLYN